MSTSFHPPGTNLKAIRSPPNPTPKQTGLLEDLEDLGEVLVLGEAGVTVVEESDLAEVVELDGVVKLTRPTKLSRMTGMRSARFLAILGIARIQTAGTSASATSPGTATRRWMACAARVPV